MRAGRPADRYIGRLEGRHVGRLTGRQAGSACLSVWSRLRQVGLHTTGSANAAIK